MLRDHFVTATALTLGLCLTAITTYGLRSGENMREHQRLEVKARHVRDAIATQIKSVTDAGKAIGWHLAQKDGDKAEVLDFDREILAANPAVLQLRWHRREKENEEAGAENNQLRESYVFPDSSKPAQAGWMESVEGRRLLQISRDTGTVVATRVTSHPEQNNGSPGVEICFPVYQKLPVFRPINIWTMEERRQNLSGFIIGWVDLTLLMIPAMDEAERLGIIFEIFDSEVPGSPPVFFKTGKTTDAQHSEVRLVVEMPARRWEVRFIPDNHTLSTEDYRVSRTALVVGMVVTLLMTFLLHRQLRSQRAVKRAQEMLRGITDTLPIGVFQYRASEGSLPQFTFVSHSAAEILGIANYPPHERPSHIFDNITPEDRSWIESKLRESCIGRQIFLEEFRAMMQGELRWLQIGATPFNADRKAMALNGYWQDVTEKKAQEGALVEAKNRAEAATEAKSVFLANMSHELRTPLNAILGYAQILQRAKNLTDNQAFGVDTIYSSGQHLLGLIDDLLDLAKIEAGKFKLYLTSFDLPAFLQDIADMIQVRAEQKGLVFLYQVSPDLPPVIHADQQRLRQILLNLLGNATKFTDKGDVRLIVQSQEHRGSTAKIRFEVHDTGTGMSEDQIKGIFQPFAQVGDVERSVAGTGLGLSISFHLARMMGGNIEVRSALGKGSVFWFELSFHVGTTVPEVSEIHKAVTAYEGPRRTLLIVDDVPANRSFLADLLKPLGFVIQEAENGPVALAQVQALPPDAILMDIRMPMMSGLEVIRRMREFPGLKNLPIIAISASAMRDDEDRSFSAGANAFVSKPVHEERLLEAIRTQLNLKWVYESADQNNFKGKSLF